MKKNRSKRNKIYSVLPLLLAVVFVVQVIFLNALPMTYLLVINGVILLFLLFIIVSQRKKTKSRFLRGSGKLLSILLSIILLVGNVYLYRTGSFLNLISSGDEMLDTISVVVLKEDTADDIKDVIDQSFGIEDDREQVVMDTVDFINKRNRSNISLVDYNSYQNLAMSLYNQEVKSIIINEAFRSFIKETYPDFDEQTKVIFTHKIIRTMDKGSNIRTSKDSFNILITGIDVYGSIDSNSRSDVNILATVNPKTKTVLLTAVPRDYYVSMPCQGGSVDKLTHAGIYGVDCTMSSLSGLFGVEVSEYVRVNFSGFIQVIDSLGGIEVNVDEPFYENGYNFYEGVNYMDGTQALVFVRDRYHQSGGDMDRGKNQMKVIKAVADKALSPTIITNYMSILSSVEGSFQTSLSQKQITELVQMQIKDMSGWDILDQRVVGTGVEDFSPALGYNAYVMYPDEDSVNNARHLINQVFEGQQ